MRNFLLYFNVSISLENFLVYDLNLFNFLFHLSDISRLLYYFFNLNILFLNRHFDWLFNFYNFRYLNNNFFYIFNLNYFFLIYCNYFLDIYFFELFICKYFFSNYFSYCWNLYDFFSLHNNFNKLFNWIIYYSFNINWNLFNDLNSLLMNSLC